MNAIVQISPALIAELQWAGWEFVEGDTIRQDGLLHTACDFGAEQASALNKCKVVGAENLFVITAHCVDCGVSIAIQSDAN